MPPLQRGTSLPVMPALPFSTPPIQPGGQQSSYLVPASGVSSSPGPLSSKAEEDKKVREWLSGMARGGGRPGPSLVSSAGPDVDMEPAPTRSVRVAGNSSADVEDTAEDDGRSEAGSAVGESVAVLEHIADILVHCAACLSKLSGVPMPDFEKDEEVDP